MQQAPHRMSQKGPVLETEGAQGRAQPRESPPQTPEAIQLAVEYDPQPPFDSGNAVEASPELKERALQLLAAPWSPSAVPSSQVASAAFRDR